jgi:hypothetical protein
LKSLRVAMISNSGQVVNIIFCIRVWFVVWLDLCCKAACGHFRTYADASQRSETQHAEG